MSGEYPPITCKELKAILAYMGFAFDTQKGSHEQAGVKKKDFYRILKQL